MGYVVFTSGSTLYSSVGPNDIDLVNDGSSRFLKTVSQSVFNQLCTNE